MVVGSDSFFVKPDSPLNFWDMFILSGKIEGDTSVICKWLEHGLELKIYVDHLDVETPFVKYS